MTGNSLAGALVVRTASQIVPAYRGKLETCKEALLEDQGLHHLAYYTGGVLDFAVDVLAHILPVPPGDSEALDRRREVFRRVGAQLVYRMVQMTRRLRVLRSGSLIRAVVQTDQGVVFCNQVVGEQCIVVFGLTPESTGWTGTPVTRLSDTLAEDRAAALLATYLRALMSQTTLNPGGWLTTPDIGDPDRAWPPAVRAGQPLPVYRQGTRDEPVYLQGTRDEPVYRQGSWDEPADLLRAAVEPDLLHYVAYHQDGHQFCTADVLDHENIAQFFSRLISPADRRSQYDRLGRELGVIVLQMAMDLAPAIGGTISRLVLDVEQGAVYYYRLSNGDYLVGVTVDQDRVSIADDRMARLATSCEQRMT